MHTKRARDAHDTVHVIKTIQDNTIDNTVSTNVDRPDKPARLPSTEINEILDFWVETVGYKIDSRVKQNRFAASNLLKKHGKAKLQQLIKGVALAQQEQYAPRISDFAQLQQKTNDLIVWGKQRTAPSTRRKGTKGVKI
jgi:hypothetical protein